MDINERLDPKAVKRLSGPAWNDVRPAFLRINDALLSASPKVSGTLTTIYIKYSSPETNDQPFSVVWVKKASEIIVGLSLPDDTDYPSLVTAPKGCKYAGITRYLVVKSKEDVPLVFDEWVDVAYATLSRKT